MTYCVGIMVDSGLILASDSRTQAGVDNFAKFCKMTVFERPGERVLVLLSSGNLAGTQAVIGVLRQTYANVVVVAITAPPDVLAQRLAARARHSDGNIAERNLACCRVPTARNGGRCRPHRTLPVKRSGPNRLSRTIMSAFHPEQTLRCDCRRPESGH